MSENLTVLKNKLLALELTFAEIKDIIKLMECNQDVYDSEGNCLHPKIYRKEIKGMGSANKWICTICDFIGKGED